MPRLRDTESAAPEAFVIVIAATLLALAALWGLAHLPTIHAALNQ